MKLIFYDTGLELYCYDLNNGNSFVKFLERVVLSIFEHS